MNMQMTPPMSPENGEMRKQVGTGNKKKGGDESLLIVEEVRISAAKMSLVSSGASASASVSPVGLSSPKKKDDSDEVEVELYDELLLSTPVKHRRNNSSMSQGSWMMMSPDVSSNQLYNSKGVFMAELTTPVTRNTTTTSTSLTSHHLSSSHSNGQETALLHPQKSMWISPEDKTSNHNHNHNQNQVHPNTTMDRLSLPMAATNQRLTLTASSVMASSSANNSNNNSNSNSTDSSSSSSNSKPLSFAPVPSLRHRSHSFQPASRHLDYCNDSADKHHKMIPLARRDSRHLPTLTSIHQQLHYVDDDHDDHHANNQEDALNHTALLTHHHHTFHNHLVLPDTPPRTTSTSFIAQNNYAADADANDDHDKPSLLRDGPLPQRHHSFTGPSQFRNLHPDLLQQLQQHDQHDHTTSTTFNHYRHYTHDNQNMVANNNINNNNNDSQTFIRYDQQYQPTRNQDYSIGVEQNPQLDSIFKTTTTTTAQNTSSTTTTTTTQPTDDLPFPSPTRQWTIQMANHVQPTFADDNSTVTSSLLSSSYHSIASLDLFPTQEHEHEHQQHHNQTDDNNTNNTVAEVIITAGMDKLKQSQDNDSETLLPVIIQTNKEGLSSQPVKQNTHSKNYNNNNDTHKRNAPTVSTNRRRRRQQREQKAYEWLRNMKLQSNLNPITDSNNMDDPTTTTTQNNTQSQQQPCLQEAASSRFLISGPNNKTTNNKTLQTVLMQPSNVFYPRATSANM